MKYFIHFLIICLFLSLSSCRKDGANFEYKTHRLNLPSFARSLEWNENNFIISGGRLEGDGFVYSFSGDFQNQQTLFSSLQYPIYDYLITDSMHYFSAYFSRVYQGNSIQNIQIYYPDTAFWVNTLNKKALRDIEDASNRGVYMVGGEGYSKGLIQYTENNGQDWIPYELDHEMRCISLQEPSTIWCGGYGILLRSIENGGAWEIMPFENIFITGIDFSNSNNAVLCDYNGSIYKSSDGGQNWKKVLNSTLNFNQVSFLDTNRIVAFGNKGSLALSQDGGDSWIYDKSFESEDLIDFVFKNERLYILSESGSVFVMEL